MSKKTILKITLSCESFKTMQVGRKKNKKKMERKYYISTSSI